MIHPIIIFLAFCRNFNILEPNVDASDVDCRISSASCRFVLESVGETIVYVGCEFCKTIFFCRLTSLFSAESSELIIPCVAANISSTSILKEADDSILIEELTLLQSSIRLIVSVSLILLLS